MKETIKLGLILLIFTAIAGGVLALTNSFTAPIIAEMEREESFGAFLDIFPDADDFLDVEETLLEEIVSSHSRVIEVYEVVENDDVVGYALKTMSGGYGGDITTITGINADGNLRGIKVINNSETPGLGTKIEEESFSDSFVDKSSESELVAVSSPAADNEVQLIAGATVSTEGVLSGVNEARDAFVNYLSN